MDDSLLRLILFFKSLSVCLCCLAWVFSAGIGQSGFSLLSAVQSAMDDSSWCPRELARAKRATALQHRLAKSGYREKRPAPCGSSSPQPAKKRKASSVSTRKQPSSSTAATSTAAGSSHKCAGAPAQAARDHNLKKLITIGSDCSGIGADCFAIKNFLYLAHRTEFKFASELDPKTRQVYTANHPTCAKVYESCCLKDRKVDGVSFSVGLCGPSCRRKKEGFLCCSVSAQIANCQQWGMSCSCRFGGSRPQWRAQYAGEPE